MLGHDQRGCKHTLKMLSILMMIFPDVTFMPVEMPGVGQLALLAVLAVPRPTTLRSGSQQLSGTENGNVNLETHPDGDGG